MQYDAFISYSHAADGRLAPAIQDGMQQLAKPWTKRRALRVFRDETGLSVNPHLWDSIVGALDNSQWFVVLASPEAAQSEWVNREVEHFLTTRPDARERLLPVVTDGVWEWDEASGGFGPATTCVPPALAAAFTSEPRHLDMSWARNEEQLHLRRADFRSAVADIAAPVHGIPKDELESEDIRIHRRSRRLRRGAVSGLVLLTAGLALASCAAFGFARNAERERSNAESSAIEAERQAEIALMREGEARDAEAQALASADEAARQEEIARQRAEEARSAQADAVASAEEAERQEALALQREQEALAAEAAAVTAQQETEAALAQVIEEQRRADENARRAEANAVRAEANANEATANAEEARANADEASRQADEAKRQQTIAETNAAIAESRALAAQALSLVEENPDLAGLVAVEGLFPGDRTTDDLATADARAAVGIAARALALAPLKRLPGSFPADTFAGDPLSDRVAIVSGTTVTLNSGRATPLARSAPTATTTFEFDRQIRAVDLSPGGRFLSASTADGLFLVDTTNGGRRRLDGPIAFDASSRVAAIDSGSGTIEVVLTDTWETIASLVVPPDSTCRFKFPLLELEVDPTGRYLLGRELDSGLWSEAEDSCASVTPGESSYRAHIWAIEDGTAPTGAFDTERSMVRAWWSAPHAVAFIDTTGTAWSAHIDRGDIQVARGQQLAVSRGVSDVEPTPDGGSYAAIDGDGNLFVGITGATDAAESPRALPYGITGRPQWGDGRRLWAQRVSGTVQSYVTGPGLDRTKHDVVDPSARREYIDGQVHDASTGVLLWAYDDRPIAVSSEGDRVLNERGEVLDAENGAVIARIALDSATDECPSCEPNALLADGGSTVVAHRLRFTETSTHLDFELWDVERGRLVGRSTIDGWLSVQPAVAPDGGRVAFATDAGLHILDVASGAITDLIDSGFVSSLGWSSDSSRLAVGFLNGTVRIVSSTTGATNGRQLEGLNGGVSGVAFDATGERLVGIEFITAKSVAGRFPGRTIVWNVRTGAALTVIDPDQLGDELIASAATHPNGFWLSTDQFSGSVGHFVLPDSDPAAVCADALAAAAAELERLLGHPSVCTTVPELRGG